MTRSWYLSGVLLLVACAGVTVPEERLYRLPLPTRADRADGGVGVLRVFDLQAATAIDGDRLVVARGARLQPRPTERWVAPLDRLVTDALVSGLARSGVCALVKAGADPGPETWCLHGRILEFAEVHAGAGPEAHVVIELWLAQGDRIVFRDEFAARTKLREAGAEAAVAALG
jgi:ABC-type uncharacterized transport system auxiliary subunit